MDTNTILSEFLSNPLPFVAGFVSGSLGLEVSKDPVRTWLESQGVTLPMPSSGPVSGSHSNGSNSSRY